ncbi:hypothetical protein PYCC9005_005593 [Savitreella phatthalungensis]
MSMMPKSEGGRKALAMAMWGGITMAVGWAFMRFTTPNDAQIYDRLSPELKRQFDREKERRRQLADVQFQQMMGQRNLDRPAWRTDVPRDAPGSTSKQTIPVSPDPHALEK